MAHASDASNSDVREMRQDQEISQQNAAATSEQCLSVEQENRRKQQPKSRPFPRSNNRGYSAGNKQRGLKDKTDKSGRKTQQQFSDKKKNRSLNPAKKDRDTRKPVEYTTKAFDESNYQHVPPSLLHGDVKAEPMLYGDIKDGVYMRKDRVLNKTNQNYQKKGFDNRTELTTSNNKLISCTTPKSESRNWRATDNSVYSSMQGSMLIEQLCDEKYECMVCCEVVKCVKAIWSCSKCYHIFHLFCIKRWARSPTALVEDENKISGWRCPACQFVEYSVPNMYKCFCGKVTNPEWHPYDGITPHSCGELCRKRRTGENCEHPCNQLCHPGPCPTCPVNVTKTCCCGKTTNTVRCGKSAVVTCSSPCGKILNCGVHSCEQICHLGDCKKCTAVQEQDCYCGKKRENGVCGTVDPIVIDGHTGYYSCNEICSKKLKCGNHECEKVCHPTQCEECGLQPDKITHCPCGRRRIEEIGSGLKRTSCLDSLPTCGDVCGRFLPCAKFNDMTKSAMEHRCKSVCHHGDCSTCDGVSIVKCRCRATSKKMNCLQLRDDIYLCELKCNKKLDCGRHRCNTKCCPGVEHKCTLICGRRLKCGKHKCEEPCHIGTCPPCLMAGFDEVFCSCGAEVQQPPISCGEPPPVCYKPCSRMHRCEHEVQHPCHYDEECPPCTILVSKWCMGEHKLRHNIPCHIEDVSCGEKCDEPLACLKHKCPKTCHRPPCLGENEDCKQLCTISREVCGHPCNALCHQGDCPQSLCKSKIQIFCKCGRKSQEAVCLKGGDKMEAAQAYQRFTTKNLADKIKGLQGGKSVDISGLINLNEKREQLECDDACLVEKRNRALAEALGISDVTRNDSVQYPHFLEEHGKSNMKLVFSVEEAFENLVIAASKAHSPSLTHSFPAMNTKNRRFVHELSTFYGCTSISYDQEPNRNTIVTSTKESRRPRVKLSTHIQRLVNPPQPPPPVPVLPDQGIGNVGETRRKSQERNNVDYFDGDF